MTQKKEKRRAIICVDRIRAGILTEDERGSRYSVTYDHTYNGQPISRTMPVQEDPYTFNRFPPFFDGLLPEGVQLEAMLRRLKLDSSDLFSQLLAVGGDLVGNVTVEPDSAGDKHSE